MNYYNLAKQISWCGISKNTFEREIKKILNFKPGSMMFHIWDINIMEIQ